jgi:hypothetical protein
MDKTANIIALAGTLIAAAVAYHIAWRQGVIGGVRARLVLGFANIGEELEEQWAVCVVLPELPVSHYVATIPITLRAEDRSPVRSPCIGVVHARQLSVLATPHIAKLMHVVVGDSVNGASHQIVGDSGVSRYEVPIVRREEDLMIFHCLAIPRTLFRDESDRLWIGEIEYQLNAENSKRQTHRSYLALALCKDGTISEDEGVRLTRALAQRSKKDRPLRGRWLWGWVAPDKPIEVRRCLIVQPFWGEAEEHPVALEASLGHGKQTQYSSARMDLVVAPDAFPRSSPQQRRFVPFEDDSQDDHTHTL